MSGSKPDTYYMFVMPVKTLATCWSNPSSLSSVVGSGFKEQDFGGHILLIFITEAEYGTIQVQPKLSDPAFYSS